MEHETGHKKATPTEGVSTIKSHSTSQKGNDNLVPAWQGIFGPVSASKGACTNGCGQARVGECMSGCERACVCTGMREWCEGVNG